MQVDEPHHLGNFSFTRYIGVVPRIVPAIVLLLSGCSLILTPLDGDIDARDSSVGDGDVTGESGIDDDGDLGQDAFSDSIDADNGLDDTACDDLFRSALFCDGFESGSLSTWWELFTDSGVAEVVADPVYRGSGALGSRTSVTGDRTASITRDFGTHSTGQIYARAYIYVPSSVSVSGLSLLIIGEDADPWHHIGFEIAPDDRAKIWFDEDQVQYFGSTPVPRDSWFCVQLRIDIANMNGEVECSIDGESVMTVGGRDTLPSAGYGLLNVGVAFAVPAQEPTTVFVDEVVLDTQPIPCDSP